MKVVKSYNANNFVIEDEQGNKVFQSYETIICKLPVNGELSISQGQPQSITTAKYLNQFLQDYTGYKNYKEIK